MRLSADEGQQPAREQRPWRADHGAPHGLAGRGVGDQLERPEDALAAHLADQGVLVGQLGQPGSRARRAPIAAALSTMPSSAIASIEATIEAIASGCPL